MTAQDNVIAVVDDSEIMREALDHFLVSAGYKPSSMRRRKNSCARRRRRAPPAW